MRRPEAPAAAVLTIVILALVACAPLPSLSAPAVILLAMLLPGRALLRIFGIDRPNPLALAASLTFVPLALHCLWLFTNERWSLLALLVVLNVALALCRRARPRAEPSAPATRAENHDWLLSAMLAWTALCVFLSLWLPRAFDHVAEQAAHDYVKHHAVVLSLVQSPLPLQNMFYAGEPGTPYYYYHFHYLIAAALVTLTGTSIAFAFALTAAATAAAFVALVAELARSVSGARQAGTLAAACVCVVGGWDILPVAWQVLHGAAPPIVLDTWCAVPWRWHNLMTQFVWCPQHVAAALAFLLGLCLLRRLPLDQRWIVLAPLLALAIFGSSAYLALTLLPCAAVAAALPLLPHSGARDAPSQPVVSRRAYALALLTIATIALLLILPLARGYAEMSARFGAGLTTTWERFPSALLGRLLPPSPLANLLDLPWLMLIDLGLPAIALLLVGRSAWRRMLSDRALRPLLLAAALGPLAMYTIRSTVNPFDYSFRLAIIPTQVFAAIVAGVLVAQRRTGWIRTVIVVGVALGLPSGLYEAPLAALRSRLRESTLAPDAEAIRYLRTLPSHAVIQGDPVVAETGASRLHLSELTDHRLGIIDPSHSHVRVFYPRHDARWRETFARVRHAFTTTSAQTAYDSLRDAGVQYVLYGSVETAHFGPPAAFENEHYFELVHRDAAARVYRLR